ncbi:MAG: protein kinase domain-containing protein [Chloroflexota bacterium]
MSESTTAFLNAKLDRYQIKEKLGTGAMARVYKGYDPKLDRDIAIKVLHEHLADDFTFKERFEQEARFVASLNHPNIVQIFDVNTLDRSGTTLYYMVMSYVPGRTLRDILEEHTRLDERLPLDRIRAITGDLASALSYAHKLGMIHRDVKPANIIIMNDGRAVLTDFGIARMAQGSKLTQEGITVGTPAYMSPEQATGEPIDSRSDLYALAIIIYEMIAGFPPFDDDGSISVLLKHLNEPVPPLSTRTRMNTPYLDSVLLKALAKRPEDRYQTVDEFAADLNRAFDGEAPLALESTGTSAPRRTRSAADDTAKPLSTLRSPLGILAVGMSVIVLLLLAGILAERTTQSADASPEDSTAITVDNEMPLFFSTDFTPDNLYSAGWPVDISDDLTREILSEGGYRISNRRFRTAIPSVFISESTYEEFAIRIRGGLVEDSAPASAYGIVFRYVDEDNYNVFAVDGRGRFSIWVRENGNWIELRNPDAPADERWTPSEMINPGGNMNVLGVAVSGNTLTGYVNGEPVAVVMDDTIAAGRVGIYVATSEQANATALVDMFEIMEAPTSMTGVEAMTGSDTVPEAEAMTGPDALSDPALETEEAENLGSG